MSHECLRGTGVFKPLTKLTVQGTLVLVQTGTGLRGERGLGGQFSSNLAMLAVSICACHCKMKISSHTALRPAFGCGIQAFKHVEVKFGFFSLSRLIYFTLLFPYPCLLVPPEIIEAQREE